jgi:hypothetical protein
MIALDQKTGAVRWSRHDFKNSHSSPLLIQLDGQEQLAAVMDKIIIGVDPADGELLWTHPHDTIGDHTVGSPVWSPDHLLFVSSAYNGGSRVLRLTREHGRTVAQELWAHKKMRIHHSNVLRIASAITGPAAISARRSCRPRMPQPASSSSAIADLRGPTPCW